MHKRHALTSGFLSFFLLARDRKGCLLPFAERDGPRVAKPAIYVYIFAVVVFMACLVFVATFVLNSCGLVTRLHELAVKFMFQHSTQPTMKGQNRVACIQGGLVHRSPGKATRRPLL